MLMWLPPSEGKNAPTSGRALAVQSLSRPDLTADRLTVCRSLGALGSGLDASRVLKVGPKTDLGANAVLESAPCAPASRLFTGVLFEAIESAAPGALSGVGAENIAIFSGLFGVLAPSDPVPDHRLAMGVSLPGLGRLSSWWAPRLDRVLRDEAASRVILDARSGPYRAACKAPWARVWELRVERERAGTRAVISHDAKRWRGALTGALLSGGGWDTWETTHCEQAISDSARAVELVDAHGVTHRVIDVEFDREKTTKQGGSTRRVTLVTN